MDVVSSSVLPVAGLRWMSPAGAPMLTVVCRATFALQPIVARLADEQDAIAAADVPPGPDPRRLPAASDLVPHKARPEVLLVGRAYAPRGQPVRAVIARLVVGSVDKSVEATPDRPLAGFGPIAPDLPPRAALAPGLGAQWARAVAADRPLPDDVDPAFFNCAPPDQQLLALRPDERLVLEHLHPKHARLITSLPGIAPRAEIARLGRPPAPLALAPDTLWIDTDRAVCALVFRGAVPLAYAGEPGCVTVHFDLPDSAGDAGEVRTMAAPLDSPKAAPAPFPIAESGTPRAPGASSALPFRSLGAMPLGAVALGAPPPAPPPPILSGPADGTPWAAQPVIAAPIVGSIGQRLALEQAMAEADAAREAPAPPEIPPLGPIAPEEPPATEPPGPAPGPAEDAASIAADPTDDDPAQEGARVVLLVHSESGLADQLRRDPRFREQVDAIAGEDGEDEPIPRIDEEDPGLLASLLARAEPSPPDVLRAALRSAARPDGRLTCPLAVVEGTLACSLDPRESLRTLASTAVAVAPDDEDLTRAAAAARAALEGGALPPPVATRLEGAILAAFRAKDRPLSPRELLGAVERALIEQRAFARRDVFDGPHVRARLACGDAPKLVVYLPEAAARALPLTRRLRARLLVEVRPREDDQEPSPLALRARALARIEHIPTD